MGNGVRSGGGLIFRLRLDGILRLLLLLAKVLESVSESSRDTSGRLDPFGLPSQHRSRRTICKCTYVLLLLVDRGCGLFSGLSLGGCRLRRGGWLSSRRGLADYKLNDLT